MIENSCSIRRHDRLTAFLKAFDLSALQCETAEAANLLIVDAEGYGSSTHLLYRPRSGAAAPNGMALLAAAAVDFGGSANPLVGALPEELRFSLVNEPQLGALSELIVAEVETVRCGGGTIRARLCEIVVVLAIRKAIAAGTVDAGLLSGLAHPELHLSLVAIHDEPARAWHIEDLARIAGITRARFIRIFTQTVGLPPGAYLNNWRLALGRTKLRSGHSVKAVAALVGFGSAEAFSRAFSRKFGHPPNREVLKAAALSAIANSTRLEFA